MAGQDGNRVPQSEENYRSASGGRTMAKIEIYNDSMQNYKKYGIPKAQLVIADVPYNVGNNFYGSNPMWYKGGR